LGTFPDMTARRLAIPSTTLLILIATNHALVYCASDSLIFETATFVDKPISARARRSVRNEITEVANNRATGVS